MKKLKIFLLLSILLCFGFALSSEVHAQGGGPKIFEVDDILPATSQLKIKFYTNDYVQNESIHFYEASAQYQYYISFGRDDYGYYSFSYKFGEYIEEIQISGSVYDEDFTQEFIIDISNVPEQYRTVAFMRDNRQWSDWDRATWEDLNAPSDNAKIFEVGDELPVGYIKISWDFTGKPIPDEAVTFMVSSGDDVFNDFIIQIDFNSGSYNHLKIFNGGSVEHFNVDTPGFTIITLTESVTITDLAGTNGITSLDYNVYIGDALTWEVVSEDYLNGFMEAREIYGFRYMGGPWMSGEAAWNHGYDKGSEETWDEGFEYGMERYGYYDPITEQWLSVGEYLDLYGTDKPGQSDFYNNFDKYFIPAMIIVFGGAIVLTILKVFKGRE